MGTKLYLQRYLSGLVLFARLFLLSLVCLFEHEGCLPCQLFTGVKISFQSNSLPVDELAAYRLIPTTHFGSLLCSIGSPSDFRGVSGSHGFQYVLGETFRH